MKTDAALLLKSSSTSTSKPKVVRVEFDPPLLGYEEVKPRLLGMKVDADEALGTVRPNPIRFDSLRLPQLLKPHPPCPFLTNCCYSQVKAPPITHFELPFQIWITASLLLLLIYTSSAPAPDSDSNHHAKFWWLARTIYHGIFPIWMVPLSWAFVIIVHTGEGVYAATLAYKHHMPWHIAVSLPFPQSSVVMGCSTARRSRARVLTYIDPHRRLGSAQSRYLASPF
jgi:hypothetical protein